MTMGDVTTFNAEHTYINVGCGFNRIIVLNLTLKYPKLI